MRKRHDVDIEDEEMEGEEYPRALRTPEWDEDEEMEGLTQEAGQVKEKAKKNKKVSIPVSFISKVCVYIDRPNLYRT